MLGNYLLLGTNVEMLTVENTHYGRAKSIMMAKGLDHLQDWDPSLYEDDESDSSSQDRIEEDVLAITTAKSDPTTNGLYLSIEENGQENTNGHGRRPPRRHSTAFVAWESVYGLNRQPVSPRRHSVFHIDSTRRDIAAAELS